MSVIRRTIGQHVVHGADAEIGNAQRACSHAAAGDIERFEAGPLCQPRCIGIDGADNLQRLFFFDCGPEPGAC